MCIIIGGVVDHHVSNAQQLTSKNGTGTGNSS